MPRGKYKYKTETQRHRQQYGGYQKEWVGDWWLRRAKYLVMEDDLSLGGGHTMQHIDNA